MKNRVISDVLSHSGRGTHPRLLLTGADFERIRSTVDPIYDAAKDNMLYYADKFMGEPVLEYRIPDGIRLLDVSRGVLARTLNLGMAYRLTGEVKYARRLYDELANAASFKDWNPYHFLDVGEMCCAFGLGYDWIYDAITPEERAILRRAIIKNGFDAAMDDYLDRERRRSYRWYQDQPGDNWKFVCNGGITVAALAICDEEDVDAEYLKEIFGYAFDNTYKAVRDMYLPDGSYAEGFTYWNYATDYLAFYVSALKSAAGTDYGLADYKPVETSAYYVKFMCSNTFRSFNFGDAIEEKICPAIVFFIGKNYGKADITTMRKEEILKDRRIVCVRDMFWYVPTESVGLEGHPMGFGSVGGDNASFRAGLNEDDLYTAIHFGDNDAYHAHADMGNFVVEWKKHRFLCDLGQDNYNVPRYRFVYRYRAEGHNTLVINPGEGPDQERFCVCHVDRFSDGSDGKGAYAVSDISSAYPGKGVVRGLRMTADGEWIIVRDELKLEKSDTGYWFGHTRGNIEILDGGKSATIEMDGDKLLLKILGEGVFSVMDAWPLYEGHVQEGQRDNSDVKRLAIAFAGAEEITVAIAPMKDGRSPDYVPENKPISEW